MACTHALALTYAPHLLFLMLFPPLLLLLPLFTPFAAASKLNFESRLSSSDFIKDSMLFASAEFSRRFYQLDVPSSLFR